MILNFFDTTKINEFADRIVTEVKRAVPPDFATRKTKKKHAIRAQAIDANIKNQVVEFAQTTRLNVYTKARFAARVRAGLSAHGYPESFIQSFSLQLIQIIQTPRKKRSG
jgi:hypothetical protein